MQKNTEILWVMLKRLLFSKYNEKVGFYVEVGIYKL